MPNSQRMIENFSKDNYEYIQRNLDDRARINGGKESEEDLMTEEKARRLR